MSVISEFSVSDPVSFNDFKAADIYTVRQVAGRLGLGASLVYTLIRSGEIPGRRLGRRWIVPRSLFHSWLNETPTRV
jgi:excisionase family DNA binding protein